MNISDWIAIIEIVVAIISIIVACIGGKQLKKANELNVKIKELQNKIEKIEINNSQVATTINNNGIGVKDAEYVAKRIVEEKTKDMPVIWHGIGEPDDSIGKDGDIYLQIIND